MESLSDYFASGFNEANRLLWMTLVPLVLGITMHESGHAWAAWRCGDATAYRLGRVSLNPLRHFDPIGTGLLPLMLMLSGSGFFFGWAKPVPVNGRNLRHPRRDHVLVLVAGPGANLVLAFAAAVLLMVAVAFGFRLEKSVVVGSVLTGMITVNIGPPFEFLVEALVTVPLSE